ncbi:hypothetical protein B566_EDAN004843 [Ephemera danica]|nr:hypothetical protein B566_EDAN004843 [Ephemera danica]
MAAVADKLKQEGWYLSSEGVEQITDNGSLTDVKAIIRKAVDLEGYRVVQVQKIRNVSAPKANEESKAAPRMLKLLLTDGNSSCQAIEVEHLPALRLQPNDRNFKSLDPLGKENKENPEFEAQRKDAIAEAARAGNKKVFGGGTKQMLDHNVQQIVDMGFSVSQAEYALKQNRNNVDRALRSLQRGGGAKAGGKSEGGRGRRKGDRDKEEEGAVAKPSSKVSLFDFLEDKLPNLNEKEAERRGGHNNSYGGERQHRGGGRSNHGGDFHFKEHQGERRGGGYSKQFHSSDSNTWSSERPGRQGERNQGQKPPRFQQQAQRFQQKQQQQQQFQAPVSKQSPTHNSSPFDSYQTWSNNDYGSNNQQQQQQQQNQWGSKDVFKQGNNDDQIGQWKPPRDRWKSDEDQFVSRPSQQSQFSQPPPSCFSEFGAAPRREDRMFGTSSDHPFSLGFSSFPSAPSPEPASSSSSNAFIPDKLWEWHEGDKCMAKYWEDNRHYRAEVTGVSDRTVVVRFVEYGNYEEVLHEDCIPITEYD